MPTPKRSFGLVLFKQPLTIRLFVTIMLSALMVSACGGGGSVRVEEKPARLQSIQESLTVNELWDYDIGDGPDAGGYKLRPAVVGSYVFLASRDGKLVSLDAETGAENWAVNTDKPFSAGPGVGDGIIAVATDQGELLAFEARTGKKLWAAAVPSEVLAVPLIAEGIVAVHAADGNMLAYATDSGKRQWSQQQVLPTLTLRGSSSPIAIGGAIFCGFDNGKVAGFDPKTGKQFFSRAVAQPTGRTQIERLIDVDADIVSDGRSSLFAATYQGKTARIDLNSGQTDWTVEQSVSAGIALGRRDVFVTDAKGHVFALGQSSGTQLWQSEALHFRGVTGPAVIEDRPLGDIVVVADRSGYIHFLGGRKGVQLARRSVNGSVWVQPVAQDRIVYVFSDTGELTAFSVPEATAASEASENSANNTSQQSESRSLGDRINSLFTPATETGDEDSE